MTLCCHSQKRIGYIEHPNICMKFIINNYLSYFPYLLILRSKKNANFSIARMETATTGQRQLVRQGGNKAGRYKTCYYRGSSRTKFVVNSLSLLACVLGRPELEQTLLYSSVLGRGNIINIVQVISTSYITRIEVDCRESNGDTDFLI